MDNQESLEKNIVYLKEMTSVLAKTDDEQLIYDFLTSILTDKELNEIASRWGLVKLLDEGVSQRKISKELGLSLCKITRGSKELKKPDSPFKQMIERTKDA